MTASDTSSNSSVERIVVLLVFVAGGLSIFLFGNNWNSLFQTNHSTLYKWSLPLLFLVLAAILRRTGVRRATPVAIALFIASFANALNWAMGNWLAGCLPPLTSTAQEIAVDKLSQSIPVVLAIVLLALLFNRDLASVFLKRGDIRWGLRFGLVSFGIFAAIFAAIVAVQAEGTLRGGLTASGLPIETIVAAIPWILVFVAANSIMEELWFRGVFLKTLQPVVGSAAAIIATALVFGSTHLGATYVTPAQAIGFALITFGLGIVNGYVMLRTGSIWGSFLFHAGYDLLIIIPVLVAG